MKIDLIDFEDSFTFNIANFFYGHGVRSDIYHWKKYINGKFKKNNIVIFGPGPGHPDDYTQVIEYIQNIINDRDSTFMGICLGHQLICRAFGLEILPVETPIHGQCRDFIVPPWDRVFKKNIQGRNQKVQVYNSLIVKRPLREVKCKLWPLEGDVLGAYGDRFVSYQFHPESIGTEENKIYFDFILDKLK